MVLVATFFCFHHEDSQILEQTGKGVYAVSIMGHFQPPAR